ncbi:MAG: hypothetical protein K0S53_1919 [Bacteroidetes bacterium]|jgi:hypothetical protein|nr:hypothetical protein [Bacteroidota bacterium]
MSVFNKIAKIPAFNIIFIATATCIGVLSYMLYKTDAVASPKQLGIISGLVTGIVIGMFQLLLSYYEYQKIRKFEEMSILDVMINRDERAFYENLIVNSNNRIAVMGVTASRFIEHFADLEANAGEKSKVLLTAMQTRNVRVQLLLPDPCFLDGPDKQTAENKVKAAFQKIKEIHGNKFEYKYFQHKPAHSIFIVDDKCILGPVFPEISSKHTPAIYLKNSSPFAQKYLEYFNTEWSNAT